MTRRVSVIVDADAGPFTTELGKAAGQAAAFKALLDGMDDRISIRVDVDGREGVQGLGDDAVRTRRAVEQTDTSINQLTGRLQAYGKAAVAIGPGLIPIGAVAGAGVVGLTNQLGVLVAAGGATVLAFQGVGDAMTAVNDFALEPTADNAAKVQQALDRLSPAAQAFVGRLDELRDVGADLRDAGAEGLFPGVTRGLDDLETMAPRVQDLVYELSDATGDLFARGTESLSSDRWADFLDYLQDTGRDTLTDLGSAAGSAAHGISELIMAMDDTNAGFGDWLADSLGDFDDWASGLDQNESFQNFLDYVDQTGPQVAETMGAIATAAIDIVQAASPLGGPVLEGFQLVAEALSLIADSPAGEKVFTMAAAFVALNSALAITSRLAGAVGLSAVSGALAGARPSARAAAPAVIPAAPRQAPLPNPAPPSFLANVRTASGGVAALARNQDRAASTGSRLARVTEQQRAAMGGVARTVGLAAAATGAFALVSTEAGQSLGVQNTAMLGLMGSLAGPWGAAIGAGVGLVLDFRAANDDLEASVESVQAAMDANSMAGLNQEYAGLSEQISQTQADQDNFWSDFVKLNGIDNNMNAITSWLGDGDEEAREQAQAVTDLQMAWSDLGAGMDLPNDMLLDTSQIAEQAAPALEALGLTYEDVRDTFNSDPLGEGAWGDMQGEIEDYLASMDSGEARTEAFANSVRALSNEALLTADSAGQMAAAFDALISPALNAEEAMDAWRTSMAGLSDELDGAADFKGIDPGSIQNKAVSRDYMRELQAVLDTQAQAGAGSRRIATLVDDARDAFIREGVAAGISARQMRRRANEMGLTPKLVRTTFQAANISRTEAQARNLRASYQRLPKEIRTMVRAGELPRTERGIDRLVRKYNLTPKQKTTLVRLRDLASGGLGKVLRGLGVVDKRTANPRVGADTAPAERGLSRTRSQLNALNSERTNPRIGADAGEANRKTGQVRGDLTQLGGMRPTPAVGINDNASGPLSGIRAQLASLQSKTITVTTVQRTVRRNALGGYWPDLGATLGGLRTYARGGMDVPGRHMAEFAGPGPTRIWREPETGGESYIPHANDFRRAGAWDVLEQTAALFGGAVVRGDRAVDRYAAGGMREGRVPYRGVGAGVGARINLAITSATIDGKLDVDTGRLVGTMRRIAVEEIEDGGTFSRSRRGRVSS